MKSFGEYKEAQNPRRVHIIGMAGSGKTTLAHHLAARLDAPMFELDAVGYEHGAGAKRPLSDRHADLQRITALPSWVTEGAFLWWIDPLLREAEAVVWLDLHWTTCWTRIVLRHVKADLARNNRHPGFRRMLHFAGSVRPRYLNPQPATPSAPDDDGANRAATALVLQPFAAKVIRCRRPADVAAFLARFS